MGLYLNPGNEAFRQIRKGIYVDKTELIDYINSTVETPAKLTSFSRPRRFGKSFAAKMLCAYYDKSCESRELFKTLKISKKKSFEKYLNQYDVIYLDITWFISTIGNIENVVSDLQKSVIQELKSSFPCVADSKEKSLPRMLADIAHTTKQKFIVIIDEWDALFREAKEDDVIQREYVQLLRGLFKGGTATDETIAAAYMTGILPIKKYGTESALTDFQEFTMTSPAKLARYVGFTEEEVKRLCRKYHMDFDRMQTWYDGYSFSKVQHVYSPNSVILAIRNEEFQNYWTASETYESLKKYIEMDFDGLKGSIVQMLGGDEVKVKISTFQNDMTSFKNKDDVLTLLIHLGYLAYNSKTQKAIIPNLEVAEAFGDAVSGTGWAYVANAIQDSDDPALVIELKYDQDADTAIRQIKERRYDGQLKEYFGNLMMVGINYDRETKKHTCVIEQA